ncbi:hypothetical protein EON65_59290 [archaeon]|nr:MAG: hypothetical protein EON65_59290 [archaeon]
MTQSATHDYSHLTHAESYYNLSLAPPDLITIPPTPTRHYHCIAEDKRIQIITLREQHYTLRERSKKTKVKEDTVQAVLRK